MVPYKVPSGLSLSNPYEKLSQLIHIIWLCHFCLNVSILSLLQLEITSQINYLAPILFLRSSFRGTQPKTLPVSQLVQQIIFLPDKKDGKKERVTLNLGRTKVCHLKYQYLLFKFCQDQILTRVERLYTWTRNS